MTYSVTKHVTNEKLPKILPRSFASLYNGMQISEPITVVAFNNKVVKSNMIRKAITKVGDESVEAILFVGHNFTQEARLLIASHSGEILAQTDFDWTDESYGHIRTYIGAAVKRPSL